jgi:hypothetical protein
MFWLAAEHFECPDGFEHHIGNTSLPISAVRAAPTVHKCFQKTIMYIGNGTRRQLQDQTPPSLTVVTMSSDNTGHTSRANAGDTITVSITASEAIVAPTVLIAGQSATVSGSGASYTATYTVQASDTGSDGAVASVSVAFTDLASNDGATVTALTAGSGVTIDLTAPSLTTVTMVSSNAGDGALANAGDTITVSLTADEAILAPTVTIAGQSAAVSGGGTSYTATYTVNSNLVVEGAVSVRYTIYFVLFLIVCCCLRGCVVCGIFWDH